MSMAAREPDAAWALGQLITYQRRGARVTVSRGPGRKAGVRRVCRPRAALSSPEDRAVQTAGAECAPDVPRLVGGICLAEAATFSYARGLRYWNRHQKFCRDLRV